MGLPAYNVSYSDTPEARYHRDPQFRALVCTLEACIHRAEFSPSEMREACLLACIHYESVTLRHRTIYVDHAGNGSFVL